jgi:thiol-disulfide isomerase/thioredoxin
MKQVIYIVAACVLATFPGGRALAQDGSSITGDRVTVEDAAHSVAAPPFVVASLDEDGTYFANESFTGRIVLVDFWATWCPPCVEALPEMEKIYEEFHPHGFDILSLSFDASDERIRRFREKRYPMPWKHARLAGAFNDVVSLSFALQNIPHYVLIGRDGSILAEGDDVHGERLRDLLSEHFAE